MFTSSAVLVLGSILGPILFSLYILPLDQTINKHISFHSYDELILIIT